MNSEKNLNKIDMTKVLARFFNPFFIALILVGLIISPMTFAQNIPSPGKAVCAYCGRTADQINTIGHAKTCPYYVAVKTTTGSTNSSQSVSTTITNTLTNDIIQGVISNILSSDPEQEKADLEAKQKEEARIAAEEQRKKMSLEEWRKFQTEEEVKRQMERDTKIKHGENLLPLMKSVGSEGNLQPLSIENPVRDANVVDLRSNPGTVQLLDIENRYNIKLEAEVPPLPDEVREIKINVDDAIDKTRGVVVDVVSILPPGLNYAAVALTDAGAADALVIHDCFFLNPPNCPSSEKVTKYIATNILIDEGSTVAGDFSGNVLKGFKGFKEMNFINDTKKAGIGIIEDVSHYKTMPASELWNMVMKHKLDIKEDVISSTTELAGSKYLDQKKINDYLNIPESGW
jgi:hypothetical protein